MAIKVKKGKGILFEAVPDNGQIGVCVGENGRAQYVWPNRVVLPDDILTKLKKETVPFLFPPPKPIEYQGASWIVNMCADADEYRNALIGLDQAFGDKLPIFNHPRAVAMTRRDLSAKLLEGIPNLIVPKCARFKADANNSFQKTFEAEGFKYPVLVRPATSQTGRDLVKIDTPFDWTKVYQTHWYGKYHYMTQFVDYKNCNGKYVKIRICFVGEHFMLRSFSEYDHWLNTATARPTISRLISFMDRVDRFPFWQEAISLAGALNDKTGLDFWGVDLGVVDDKKFVLFEANAAMTMSNPSTIPKEFIHIIKPLYAKISGTLTELIHDPHRWRWRGCGTNASSTEHLLKYSHE